MGKWTFLQKLVVGTAFVAVLGLVGAFVLQMRKEVPPVEIPTAGQPTIGNPEAKVEIVVFEDFLCTTCRMFNEVIFPKIQSKYIASGQVRYVLIPLAFIEGSAPLGNAALGVYKIAPEKFFPYVHQLFTYFDKHIPEETPLEVYVDLAKKVGVLELDKLRECMKELCHTPELERNFYLARELMGKEFGAPAIYINGVRTSPLNYRKIEVKIDKALYEVKQ